MRVGLDNARAKTLQLRVGRHQKEKYGFPILECFKAVESDGGRMRLGIKCAFASEERLEVVPFKKQ